MPRSRAQLAETDAGRAEPVTYPRPVVDSADAVAELTRRVEALGAGLEDLEERFHETLASLTIAVVDGYFVKAWPDLETGQWVAECAAVGACVQEATRDGALKAIRAMVPEVLAALKDWGEALPPKDV